MVTWFYYPSVQVSLWTLTFKATTYHSLNFKKKKKNQTDKRSQHFFSPLEKKMVTKRREKHLDSIDWV